MTKQETTTISGAYDFYKSNPGELPLIRKSFTLSGNPSAKVYNIELKGVGHTDYFIKPGEREKLAREGSIKIKAEAFLAALAKNAVSENNLEDFLSGFPRAVDGTIVVDLE